MTPEHLSWFLGPKAENAEDLERLLLLVFRDYIHWRRNYFPADAFLLSESLRRKYNAHRDQLDEQTQRLLALLRRNFPFYSPRYLAHELSDTLIPATLGFFAGLLYNANNVTPEAAPVTVDLEVEACSAMLRMLGYRPPPTPPKGDVDVERFYAEESAKGFGWAHLSPGGTLSNIEALWVARDVKYFPFAVRDVAKSRGISLGVKLPSGKQRSLTELTDAEVASLRPNECVYLLARFVDGLRRSETGDDLSGSAWKLLNESVFSISRGIHAATSMAPPVILVASTAHYSIRKAAQVLGLGRESVWTVPVDAHFRMDTKSLEEKIIRARSKGLNPFCVIATAGSTEEGAVDPIHEIVDLRAKFEKKHDFSFWLHVDAAWGGFIRTLFCPEDQAHARAVASKAAKVLKLPEPDQELHTWHGQLQELIDARIARPEAGTAPPDEPKEPHDAGPMTGETATTTKSPTEEPSKERAGPAVRAANRAKMVLSSMEQMLDEGDFARYAERLETLPAQLSNSVDLQIEPDALRWTFDDFHRELTEYASSAFSVELDRYRKEYLIFWPARDVCAAFLRIASADSITLDPHKMGFVPYPAGAVAFKNDRIRHFIRQEAPYITAKNQSTLVHRPPIHRATGPGAERIHRDAFGPFILDGSRPGAAAAGVWLATKAVPLTRHAHGSIVRASVLAAKALYEWLSQWATMHLKIEKDIDYEFVPLTDRGPDTNLVTFTVKKRTSSSLEAMNALTEAVYHEFTIEAELGETEYSYSQPFFLSRTVHDVNTYSVVEIEPFAVRSGMNKNWPQEYERKGLTVLRATVMNPYLTPLRELGREDLIRMFVTTVARVAAAEVRKL